MVTIIKDAKKSDKKQLTQIFMTEFNKKFYEKGWSAKSAATKIDFYLRTSRIRVALIDKKIAGFVVYSLEPWQNGKWMRVNDIAVSTNVQGHGVGSNLMNDIENQAKKNNAKNIILEVYRNCPLYGFFKKVNYQDSGWVQMSMKKR